MDVTQLSDARSRLGAGSQPQSAQRPNLIGAEIGSFSSRATPGATSSSSQPQTSQTDDDIPEWKRAMLERQAARNREAAAYSTPTPTATNTSSDNRLSSSSSKTVVPTPISTNKPSQPSSTKEDSSAAASRFRRAESEDQTLSTSFRQRKTLSFEDQEDAASRNRRLEEAAKERSKVTFSEPSKPESKLNSYSSWNTPKSSTTTDSSSSYSSSYGSSQATSSSSTSKASTTSTKQETSSTAAPKTPPQPSWKKSVTKTSPDSSTPSTPEKPIPSWKKQAVAAPPKVEKVEEKVPSWKTPSWKQHKEAKVEESKPKLGNISESAPSSTRSTSAKTKSSTSSTLENSYSSSTSSAKNGSDSSSTFDRSTIGYGTSGSATTNSSIGYGTSGAATTSSTIGYGTAGAGDSGISAAKLKSLESEVNDLKATVTKLERKNSTLQKEKDSLELNKGRTTPTIKTFEEAKASETAAELLKAKEQLREQESKLSRLETEKKGLSLRTKELETQLERRPLAADTNKSISELQTKLKYYEKKSFDLEKENSDLLNNVQNLEQEMEFPLTHGSLCVMGGRFQEFYQHAVPPMEGDTQVGYRINLTFRNVKDPTKKPEKEFWNS